MGMTNDQASMTHVVITGRRTHFTGPQRRCYFYVPLAVPVSAMFTFRKPTEEGVRKLLARQDKAAWSYPFAGGTANPQPQPLPGWQIDHHRVLLGHGEAVFAAACHAIRHWKMFPRQMSQILWPTTRQEPGQVVAVLYRARPFLLWMLFPARVVYRIEEVNRFGFAYGTLPEHPERGEERFLIEWNQSDNSIWYDLLAISRPGHWLARLGYPYARYEQAKFRRLSGLAMQKAVS
jgi:uncharacterized protein (UPF0548 family)